MAGVTGVIGETKFQNAVRMREPAPRLAKSFHLKAKLELDRRDESVRGTCRRVINMYSSLQIKCQHFSPVQASIPTLRHL